MPLDMRILKIVYLFFGLWFAASAVLGVLEIHSAYGQTGDANHAILRAISSILLSAFCGAAVYGIHKRTLIAWKLGWGVIATGFLEFLVSAFSALSKTPRNDHPGIAMAAVVVMAAAVALYWGVWWNKKKSYFIKLPPTAK